MAATGAGFQRVGIDTAPIDTPPFWMGNYWVTGIQSWCWSNLNWTATDLDALEIGVKTVNGEWLEVSQLYTRVYTTAP